MCMKYEKPETGAGGGLCPALGHNRLIIFFILPFIKLNPSEEFVDIVRITLYLKQESKLKKCTEIFEYLILVI